MALCSHVAAQAFADLDSAESYVLLQHRGLVDSLAAASVNAADGGLVRSVLACGFYPLVGRLLPQPKGWGGPAAKTALITAKDEKVKPLCTWTADIISSRWHAYKSHAPGASE